jgi:excisionase family DNA binding protein
MALKDRYFSVSQAAKEIGVTRQAIHRWIASGKIPAEKVGRETLIAKKDLYKYYRWKLSETAADSIVSLWLGIAEDYCREKGYLTENTKVDFVSDDRSDIVRELSDKERAEIQERFRPILEGFLKDFDDKIGKYTVKKREGKKTKRGVVS